MTIKITPQEFLFQENINPIQVQTTCSRELLDDPKMYLRHVRHFNLKAGTVILVQVMDEAKDILFHEAEFRVTSAVKSLHGITDEYGSKVREETHYTVQRWSDWKSTGLEPEEEVLAPEREAERYVPGEAEAKWNPGLKTFEIKIGDEVLGTERDKDRALAVAAGSEPLAA